MNFLTRVGIVFIVIACAALAWKAPLPNLENTACDPGYVTKVHEYYGRSKVIDAHNVWARQIQNGKVNQRTARAAVVQLRNGLNYFGEAYHPLFSNARPIPQLMLSDLQARMSEAGYAKPKSLVQGLQTLKGKLKGTQVKKVVSLLSGYSYELLPLYDEGIQILANDADSTLTSSCQRYRQRFDLNPSILMQGIRWKFQEWLRFNIPFVGRFCAIGLFTGLMHWFFFHRNWRMLLFWPLTFTISYFITAITDTFFPLPAWQETLMALTLIPLCYVLYLWGQSGRKADTHGSANWASFGDALKQKRIQAARRGVYTDQFNLGNIPQTGLVYDTNFNYMGHVLTCAPTGAGKGVGAVIPNLLSYVGSVVVLDIKGENYAVTAEHRAAMGQKVVLIDPFGVSDAGGFSYNWLEHLNPNDQDVVSKAALLADMLVDASDSNYWDESAKDLLKGLLVYVAGFSAERHMGTVRKILTSPEADVKTTLEKMADSSAGFGLVARTANAFLGKAEKDRSGVLSSAIRHTAFLDDPRIIESLMKSDFDLRALKEKLMTIYIVMPPANISAYHRYLRAFIGLSLAVITESQDQPRYKVAFFLDEFAQLGRIQAIEDGISLVRGYGAAFWIFVQDLSQLKAVYPKWQTFLANTAKQFFGTADLDTAKYISDTIGETTVAVKTKGQSRHTTKNSGHRSTNYQWVSRPLITPDEVMRRGPEQPIIIVSGERPYELKRLNYLKDRQYKGLAAGNPYHN